MRKMILLKIFQIHRNVRELNFKIHKIQNYKVPKNIRGVGIYFLMGGLKKIATHHGWRI